MIDKVYLKKESPYAGLFPDGVPVQDSFRPGIVTIGAGERIEAYMLDIKRCTKTQLDNLIILIAKTFNSDPIEVSHDLMTVGMPIRKTQVIDVHTKPDGMRKFI